MSYPFVFEGVWAIDARSVLFASVALFVSLPALLVSSSLKLIYAIYLDGIGMIFGVLIIVICILIGILWRKYIYQKIDISDWLNIYLYALLIHGTIIISFYIFPKNLVSAAISTLSLPMIALYPVTMIIVRAFFLAEKKHEDSSDLIEKADQKFLNHFNHQHTFLLVIDPKDGQIIDANPGAVEFYGWSKNILIRKNWLISVYQFLTRFKKS
jgi:PAS domain-containing protein